MELVAERESRFLERVAKLNPRPGAVEEALRRRCADEGIDLASEEASRLREMLTAIEKVSISFGREWFASDLSALEFKNGNGNIIHSRVNGAVIYRRDSIRNVWEKVGHDEFAAHPRLTEEKYDEMAMSFGF